MVVPPLTYSSPKGPMPPGARVVTGPLRRRQPTAGQLVLTTTPNAFYVGELRLWVDGVPFVVRFDDDRGSIGQDASTAIPGCLRLGREEGTR
jgi:hypothetical protein